MQHAGAGDTRLGVLGREGELLCICGSFLGLVNERHHLWRLVLLPDGRKVDAQALLLRLCAHLHHSHLQARSPRNIWQEDRRREALGVG